MAEDTKTVSQDKDTPIIFLDDISVTFKTRTGTLLHPNLVHAVQNVSIKLMPGETIGIVGESGCGKSTTGKLVLGLVPPTAGTVCYRGEALPRVRHFAGGSPPEAR